LAQREVLVDGVKPGVSSHKASDGVILEILYNDFNSEQQATELFDKELAKAVKIVERPTKLGKSGKAVGKRAQIVISGSKPSETISVVLWTGQSSTKSARFHSRTFLNWRGYIGTFV
jgi:hypothetical protein